MSIIGISGRMGSGKNTVGDIIEKICLTNEGPVFEQRSFAGKLKQIASLLTGIPVEKFEDQEFKKSLLGDEWGVVKDNPLNAIPVFEDVQFNHLMSVREFLQKLGTEAMRDGLHTNVWVNALFADYKSKRELLQADGTWIESDTGEVDFAVSIKYPKWIITDLRFPNEYKAVKEKGGITIRVVRPHGYTNPHTGVYKEMPLSYHPSETALDDAKFDYEIINDGEIVDLIEKVKTILIKEKII
jgi:hypothetical protein